MSETVKEKKKKKLPKEKIIRVMKKPQTKESIKFDGFAVKLYHDKEDDWVAYFEELPNISAFGNTPSKAITELSFAWNAVKESCKKRNQPIPQSLSRKEYSGSFNVRIDKRVHKLLAIEAMQAGISLNALVSQKLAKGVKN